MKQMERRIKKGMLFVPIFIGGLFLFTWIIMLLWNGILPDVVTGIKDISFFQAMGILVLSKILFGFNKGWGGGSRYHRRKQLMEEKLQRMTPEEREQFKAEWKHRCGGRWRRFEKPETGITTTE
ncbi:MAG TPA: hypothetical protein VHL77_07125 [Ferruginibacter sp.]|jgi:hypothetical protein|nr:hypothetical protein [Ferruginibacter sp.]